MPLSNEENASVIEALREVFAPLVSRLTPEIEPAVIFSLESKAGE